MTTQAEVRLEAAIARRSSLVEATEALRLVHGEADGFEGLTVDRYGPALLVERHLAGAAVEPLIEALSARFGPETPLFLKRRDSKGEADLSGEQVRGPESPAELEVEEGGSRFVVHLARGEHTGLFLDARPAREVVRSQAAGRRVLNLFAYTGAFGVVAAAGGARATTNVDNKRSALAAAQRNYAGNGLPADSRTFLKSDVVPFLNRAARGRGRYDLVVVDPPPRSRRRGGRGFDAREGYGRLIARCLRVIEPGGLLFSGLNARGVDDEAFERALAEAATAAAVSLRVRAWVGPGVDFPPGARRPTARFVLAEVG